MPFCLKSCACNLWNLIQYDYMPDCSEDFSNCTKSTNLSAIQCQIAHKITYSGVRLHIRLLILVSDCTQDYIFLCQIAHKITYSGVRLHIRLLILVSDCTQDYLFQSQIAHKITYSGVRLHHKCNQVRLMAGFVVSLYV